MDDNVRGKVVLTFIEEPNGDWKSEVQPVVLPTDIRDQYKLALITAQIQATLKKSLVYIDAVIKSKKEIVKIHNELVAEKTGKPVPDTEKYQTKLPFESNDGVKVGEADDDDD
jgi:hypothetical protein